MLIKMYFYFILFLLWFHFVCMYQFNNCHQADTEICSAYRFL